MTVSGTKPVILGRVSGLHGVRGWVKVHSFTDPRAAILDYTDWSLRLDGVERPARLAEGRPHGKTLIAKFEDIDDRDQAAALVGSEIGVPRDRLPDTEQGEFYWVDLEGLDVVNKAGQRLGRVAYLLETGANDVMVVAGDKEILIPFIRDDVIHDVDLAGGVITVDWDWD